MPRWSARRCPAAAGAAGADADDRDQVAVALEHLVVAQEDDRQRKQDQADHEPGRLVAREPLVEAEEHHDAECRQQRYEWEKEGVGVGQARADHEVRREADAEEVEAVEDAEVVDLIGLDDQDRGESRGDQQRDWNQREELSAASAHGALLPPAAPCLFAFGFGFAASGAGRRGQRAPLPRGPRCPRGCPWRRSRSGACARSRPPGARSRGRRPGRRSTPARSTARCRAGGHRAGRGRPRPCRPRRFRGSRPAWLRSTPRRSRRRSRRR